MQTEFDNTRQVYRLIIPPEIIECLQLTDNGIPFEPVHEQKMSLEWLAADIERRYNELTELQAKANKRRRKKMIAAIVVVIVAASVSLAAGKLTTALDMPRGILRIMALLITFFAAWQLLQLYLLNKMGATGLKEDIKNIELKEMIRTRYLHLH